MTDTPVAKEVWRPFSCFKKGRELVELAYDCFIAHKQAAEIAKVLHRDVSAGNMLIYDYISEGKMKRRGLLVDWELSKPLGFRGKRQFERTGTWQFMSALALEDLGWSVGIPDDLESVLYVILWHAVRFLPNNCANIGAFMTKFFDEADYSNAKPCGGFAKRSALSMGYILVNNGKSHSKLRFRINNFPSSANEAHPLTAFLAAILESFRPYYLAHQGDDAPVYEANIDHYRPLDHTVSSAHQSELPSAKGEATQTPLVRHIVEDHLAMQKTFNRFLDKDLSWPENDKIEDQLPPTYDYVKSQNYPEHKRSSRLQLSITPASDSRPEGADVPGPSTKRQRVLRGTGIPIPPSNAGAGPSGSTPAPARKAGGKRTGTVKSRARK